MYAILSFNTDEDFITYKRTIEKMGLKLEATDIAFHVTPERTKVSVAIKVNFPIPKGILHTETHIGEKMDIEVSYYEGGKSSS